MQQEPVRILLVEDNEGDIELTKIAFRQGVGAPLVDLSVAHDGEEAVAYLGRRGKFHNAPRPDLILLDLNMPKMGGKEFLEIVKRDARLKSIPVIMLTISAAPVDILECYARHANCYILKPPDLPTFIETALKVQYFWTDLARLPRVAE